MNTKKNIYEVVTERVIAGLKEQGLKYFRPFTVDGNIYAPVNHSTGKAYKGINTFLLNAEMWAHGYSRNEWVTYKQAEACGGSVKKGAQATGIVFWNVSYCHKDKWYSAAQLQKAGIRKADASEGWSMRVYYVFNLEQCEGLEAKYSSEANATLEPSLLDAYCTRESIFTIVGDKAAYSPSKDAIMMPPRDSFVSQAAYDHTFIHEAIHSTGHPKRLKRFEMDTEFGKEAYSKEELVAEMGAQMLSSLWDIDFDQESSQAYINGWASALTDDPKLIVYAASQASKAVDRIIESSQAYMAG
jgi:antirestriction protein ArdC